MHQPATGRTAVEDRALLLKIPEAADRLRLSRATIYELLAAGEIKAVHIGRAVRIPAAELERYVRQLQAEAGAPR
jgi:excisionase family DNA binding protein